MRPAAILPVPQHYAGRRDAVFAEVAGQSPLMRILRSLESVGDIVVAASDDLVRDVAETLSRHHVSTVRVVAAPAPGLRADCITAGLRGLDDDRAVLLHDMAWPLIAPVTLNNVVDALRTGAAAVLPASPVTDSIKSVDGQGAVTATVDRAPLRTIQYPRGYAAAVLATLVTHGPAGAFDDVDAVLSTGTPVTLVDGDTDTTRVDLPEDGDYLTAVIEGGRVAGR